LVDHQEKKLRAFDRKVRTASDTLTNDLKGHKEKNKKLTDDL